MGPRGNLNNPGYKRQGVKIDPKPTKKRLQSLTGAFSVGSAEHLSSRVSALIVRHSDQHNAGGGAVATSAGNSDGVNAITVIA